jgi:hypothetical protein
MPREAVDDMPELIGATYFHARTGSLKRHLLLFDRIAWPEAASYVRVYRDAIREERNSRTFNSCLIAE